MTKSDAARALNAMRKTHAGGRPKKPTPCPRCGAKCAGARAARDHCRQARGEV